MSNAAPPAFRRSGTDFLRRAGADSWVWHSLAQDRERKPLKSLVFSRGIPLATLQCPGRIGGRTMKTCRRLWMVAVIAACLAGCGARSKAPAWRESACSECLSDSAANPAPGQLLQQPAAASMTASPMVPSSSGAAGSSAGAPTPTPSDSDASGESGLRSSQNSTQSGTLTAGAWDDNLNFDRFRELALGAAAEPASPARCRRPTRSTRRRTSAGAATARRTRCSTSRS